MTNAVYRAIVKQIQAGRLTEPFSATDFRAACPEFGVGTYKAFLWKHSRGNRKTTELFEKMSPGKFRCLRPFRYGLQGYPPATASNLASVSG